ncbi:hemerythrin domain-containing protein [Caldimonas thermodepolymerans]|jgi:Uncharacterized conserved protein|uniref:Hemerythrin HHE cation binding domain-containing protein n=1 Tax=Caldimonas thermodepolymerans TaxID=215580 RepID=A0AA46DGG4_9BURK|nr:hemerythrin domain-containing protein [Caldimonas thermodepolymerans]TCP08808.1 hemerythrin HHE cation binding domain-containing protein [Caldimonas thermodepolymerans]UZG43461.1 hemerythrin domain-containing protein [Caldimonas thermodepolymerans]UZG47129.1 hemerythrin domain-containing protein [Caldimonas thermodepolymerans]
MLPGFSSPAASFDQPFEMLAACHDRVRRSLRRLTLLVPHLQAHGNDAPARQAAADVLRYFDLAAPHHHEDEERHVFPPLLACGPAAVQAAVRQLQQEHREMARAWAALRPGLQRLADGEADTLDEADAGRIQRFVALYEAHLRLEDEQVYPVARQQIDAAALPAIGAEMARRRGAPAPGTQDLPGRR